jgi:hypothetical protein
VTPVQIHTETPICPVDQGMNARTPDQIIDDLNQLRHHISRAEAAGSISVFFACRLRLMADKAETRLSPPTRIDRAFAAVDKVIPFPGKAVQHGAI